MHAYLIVGKNKDQSRDKINEITKKGGGRALNFRVEKIEDVRDLAVFLKLSQAEPTFIVIEDFEKATVEAANSFLKNLEEPTINTNFILTTSNEFKILPTILSRCQVIRISGSKKSGRVENLETALNFLIASAEERLTIVSKIKNRDEAKEFLENLIYKAHEELLQKNTTFKNAKMLEITQNALDNLNANGNVTLQLTNLVVQLENNKSSGSMDREV